MSASDPRLAALVEDFDLLDDWESRYGHVIELGRALPRLAEHERVEAAKVRGCASQVWLLSEFDGETGRVRFRGESDAAIVQGLLAILLHLHSDRTPADILALDTEKAFAALKLSDALTPQRSNGLKAMATRIKDVAKDALAAAPVTPPA